MSKIPTIEVWSTSSVPEAFHAPEALALAPAATAVAEPELGRSFFSLRANTVSLPDLLKNLQDTLAQFQQTMDALPKPTAGYSIEEIELHLGVNGNGGIALIGKMEVGMEAAIKVKIKRSS